MTVDLNRVTLIGTIETDPDTKYLQSGQVLTRMKVVTQDSYTDKEGNPKTRTDWHTVVAWGKLAEKTGGSVSKNDRVYVEGRIQTRSWDKNGVKQYTTEVVAREIVPMGTIQQGMHQEDVGGEEPEERDMPF